MSEGARAGHEPRGARGSGRASAARALTPGAGGVDSAVQELLESAAVQLFADRAVDAGADTAWDDRQWTAVGEICRRVDGIPLAIELAAARTTSMSPADVAAHLDERFRLLTGKRRGRLERHQTLRATVDWSYQLLDDDVRLVFDRLGVFAGTFDAAAAIAVAGERRPRRLGGHRRPLESCGQVHAHRRDRSRRHDALRDA